MSAFKPLSLREITDVLECEQFWEDFDELRNVYIEPPDNHMLSDEDSAEEDNGGKIDNLSGHQLQGRAEAVFQSGKRIGIENEEWDSEDDFPLSHLVEKPVQWNWSKEDDLTENNMNHLFPENNNSPYRNMSPVELFELFMDQAVIELLTEESTKYALFSNFPDPKITSEEMRCFIGILIVSGYCILPSKKLFWDNGEDVRNSLVYKSMRRDRFIQIMKFLHCNDNNKLDVTDKFTKLRPFMNLLKHRFLQHYVPQQEISYDESMIEYYAPRM